jgi:outer membrane protein TolC
MSTRRAQNPRRRAGVLAAALCCAALAATAAEPLPDPLSLGHALSLAADDHPSLALSRAEMAAAEAERAEVDAENGLYAAARLNARYIDDSNVPVQQKSNDSRALLLVRKELYDFGRSDSDLAAAEAALRGSEWQLRDRMQQRRLDIAKAFFEVILADLNFTRENESMAEAFVELDRARDRNELGQLSDIEVLELDDAYQAVRLRRFRAEAEQRASRARLAQALNRPDELPARLSTPALPANDSPLPDYEPLIEAALQQNPVLLALRQQLEASRLRVAASRRGAYPVLSTELNAGWWNRDIGNNREPFGASLILDIPLITGGRTDAEIAKEQADNYRLQAEVQQLEYDLRQQVLETWQEIQALRAQRDAADVKRDYRDLYLDRSRAEYELDIKTDLGDAMAQQSAARLFAARTEFSLALAWARLAALVGEPDFNPISPPGENPLSRLVGEATP